jgi:hypothetical protein
VLRLKGRLWPIVALPSAKSSVGFLIRKRTFPKMVEMPNVSPRSGAATPWLPCVVD